RPELRARVAVRDPCLFPRLVEGDTPVRREALEHGGVADVRWAHAPYSPRAAAPLRSIGRSTRHGFPTATTPGGMSEVTTEPAPMMLSSPLVTPGVIVTEPPIHTLLPITTGSGSSHPSRRRTRSSA